MSGNDVEVDVNTWVGKGGCDCGRGVVVKEVWVDVTVGEV